MLDKIIVCLERDIGDCPKTIRTRRNDKHPNTKKHPKPLPTKLPVFDHVEWLQNGSIINNFINFYWYRYSSATIEMQALIITWKNELNLNPTDIFVEYQTILPILENKPIVESQRCWASLII